MSSETSMGSAHTRIIIDFISHLSDVDPYPLENHLVGYLNDAEATASTIDVDGWLHTGDIGYVDDDNEIFIVDRVKELIKFKGFQASFTFFYWLFVFTPKLYIRSVRTIN